jgi:chemotaxis protein CheY-P-specific phosphatase CheC
MPEKKIDSTTAAVISRIIGDAAFMFTDPLDSAARPSLSDWKTLGVRLSFSGDIAGDFRLWAPPTLARGIAVNMLGVDQTTQLTDEKLEDALKEIVNIIVGNFITDMYGDEVVSTLGLPSMMEPASLAEDYQNPSSIWLSVEGDPIVCFMRITKESGNTIHQSAPS